MLRRLGLQRRIITYVIVGLVLMFGAFAYLGLQAVQHSTQLVFQERLNVAYSITAAIGQSIGRLAADIEMSLVEQAPGYNVQKLQEGVEQALVRSESSQAAFFSVVALELRDRKDELIARAPQGFVSAIPAATLASKIASTAEKPRLVASVPP